jgi:dTDP-4-dehydrorhamnose 3,5-epimerase
VIFTPTPIAGALVIELEQLADERGFFARVFCAREFEQHGLNPRVVQCSISFNPIEGTVRGLHLQRAPHLETKLVRCTAGALYDVIVDVRPDSPTFRKHFAVDLSACNRKMLYVPEGVAHGFQTLEDGTEVFYQMSEAFAPHATTGWRWNDPAFGIAWPLDVTVMSDRDRDYPDFQADALRRVT